MSNELTGPEAYREAVRLLREGDKVVQEIREAKGDEARRDALGKQARGIWAQAQVYATLAHAARDASRETALRVQIAKEIRAGAALPATRRVEGSLWVVVERAARIAEGGTDE